MTFLSKFSLPQISLDDIKTLVANPTFIASSVLSSLVVIYFGKIWMSYGLFKKLGVKTPKYRFLYGNLKEIIANGYSNQYQLWTRELGVSTYGFYEGHLPVLVTSDLDLIQEIFIKKFSYFSPRKMSPHISSDDDPSLDLFTSGGEKWKRYRTIMNLTFTWTKMKELIPLMQMCSERFFDVLDKQTDQVVMISDYFDRLTMDTIFNCAFGIDLDAQKNIDSIFLTAGIEHFRERARFPLKLRIIFLFHEFKIYLNAVNRKMPVLLGSLSKNMVPKIYQLYANIHKVLQERISKKIYKKDYAQILIDSCNEEFDKKNEKEYVEFNKLRFEKTLGPKEIINHLVLFLLTGFETTSTTLSCAVFELTKNTAVMRKLQEEIDAVFPPDQEFEPNLDKINNMAYLDMFLKEVLRMHPPANGAVTRRCVEPTTVKGISFPLNLVIAVDVLSLHFSEDYWESPHEFNPLRFAPENDINPLVYMPFGVGPRLCIGMRFAQLEAKLMIVKLLRKYDIFSPTPTPPSKLEYAEGIVRRPKNGVSAVFKPRKFN